MNTLLISQIQGADLNINSSLVKDAMEEIKQAVEDQNWEEVIYWRELLYYKLNQERYWLEAAQVNQWAIQATKNLNQVVLAARFTHDLADINAQQGYYVQAEPLYKESFEIFERQVKDPISATKSLHMLSLAKRALGNSLEAEKLAYDCIERATKHSMGAWRAHPLHLLALLVRDKGEFSTALAHLKEALSIHETNQEHDRGPMLAQSHYDIARVLIMMDQPEEAETHVLEAINWSNRGGIPRMALQDLPG